MHTVYFLKDHLGSVRATIDDAGQVVAYDDYDPWGMILPGRSMSAQANLPNKFTGNEHDDDFGLNWDYFGARYYDAVIGRFPTIDPLADRFSSVSPYSYPFNNPLRYTDPTGMAGDDKSEKDTPDGVIEFLKPLRVLNTLITKIAEVVQNTPESTTKLIKETGEGITEATAEAVEGAIETTETIADNISDASGGGVVGGIAVTGLGLAFQNPAITGVGLKTIAFSSSIGTISDIISIGATATKAMFFNGSTKTIAGKTQKAVFNATGGKVATGVAGRVATNRFWNQGYQTLTRYIWAH